MQLGIIGMPMVGKTTMFTLLTGSSDKGSPGKTQTAIARIPDPRIDYLSGVFKPKKTTYAQLEVIDIPGLTPGGEKNAALFLDAVRRADALLHVVRLFDNESVPYIYDSIDPMRDIETINYELLLSDLDLIEKRIERINSNKKRSQMLRELGLLERLRDALSDEKPISSVTIDDDEQEMMSTYQFLTNKPLLICLNISENEINQEEYPQKDRIMEFSRQTNIPVVAVSAEIEREIAELEPTEKEAFMQDLGITETGLAKISRSMYERLGLISFFTVGEDEVKAWTIEAGTSARKAAGKIHSDIERGFIRAEVVDYQVFKDLGSMAAVKEKGLFRLEGKEYVVKDGEIVHFRFNV
ncbi:MAG TPA: redox-regulated ATPase YchF [Syntrophomonadaceae bacterium]|jgi:GTP-binding protein YchF|nr:redox-regulated ATPase YchF [Syntrophomonadaceae bacterium]